MKLSIRREWLGSRDSNPDSMIQLHLFYLIDPFIRYFGMKYAKRREAAAGSI
jgi:hypothetical protein